MGGDAEDKEEALHAKTSRDENASVGAKSVRAVRSTYIGNIVRIAAQLVAQIFILRALGPETVGTFGYVLLLFGVLALVIDQGFGWSLIQGGFDSREEISVVFSRIMLLSACCMLGTVALSYGVEEWLSNRDIGPVMRYSAPAFLLCGLFVVPQARLRAELRFAEIQQAFTGAYLAAYPLVGVVMAYSGFGIWSLVVAWYVQLAVQAGVALFYCPHSFRLSSPFAPTRAGPVGRHVAAINLLNWAVENSGSAVAGTMGASAIGNFNAASVIARAPAVNLVTSLQSVVFSAATVLRKDTDQMRQMFLGGTALLSLIVVPIYGFTYVHSAFVIHLLFGDEWAAAGPVLASLCPGMIALAIGTLCAPLLVAMGDQKWVTISQVLCLLTVSVGILALGGIDVYAIGASISAGYILATTIQVSALSKKKIIQANDLLVALRGPIIIALVFAIPLFVAAEHAAPALSEVLIALAVKSVVVAALIWMFPRLFVCPSLVRILGTVRTGSTVLGWLRLDYAYQRES